MIRCEACRTLNEDNARSCTWCGTSLWLSGRAPTGEISRGPATQQQQQQSTYAPPRYAPPAVQPQPAPVQRQGGGGYRCPYCHSNAMPFRVEKITEAGWVMFAVMLVFCLPLFWIGLLMKESQQFCSACRARLS
jgi:hypothetical protein